MIESYWVVAGVRLAVGTVYKYVRGIERNCVLSMRISIGVCAATKAVVVNRTDVSTSLMYEERCGKYGMSIVTRVAGYYVNK